jgi:hypothetical protein
MNLLAKTLNPAEMLTCFPAVPGQPGILFSEFWGPLLTYNSPWSGNVWSLSYYLASVTHSLVHNIPNPIHASVSKLHVFLHICGSVICSFPVTTGFSIAYCHSFLFTPSKAASQSSHSLSAHNRVPQTTSCCLPATSALSAFSIHVCLRQLGDTNINGKVTIVK